MIVDLVLETGKTRGIGARLAPIPKRLAVPTEQAALQWSSGRRPER